MKIAILGTGTWGTTLAQILTDNGYEALLYGVDENEVQDINLNHQNSKYFKDIRLSDKIKATMDLKTAVDRASYILLAVPTAFMRDVLVKLRPLLTEKVTLINAAKGFDPLTGERISTLIREIIPETLRREVASLIGPGHAEEVIIRMLTTVCAVSRDAEVAREVQRLFSNEYFRVYTQDDEIGAEYGVAIKNIIALASGALAGLGYGDNTRAALMTRGLAEMTRYGVRKGGRPETYLGLTGIGDLIVTCSSLHSRNFQAGYAIGKDNDATRFMAENTMTVEGIRSCQVVYDDLKNYDDLEMPITAAVYAVLYEKKKPSEVITALMTRDLKREQ